jgi:magnesium-transporting ATPase (P-type)
LPKEARLAIAQGSGTQMARTVADLVLVRDDFAVVPGMVAEGRQILRNIQRVAQLFVTKTVFTAVVGVAVAIPTATFPLLPRQFTIASTVTIGIPAFVLALVPSSGPWRPERFLRSSRASPSRPGSRLGSGSSPVISWRATASTSAWAARARSRRESWSRAGSPS